MTKIVEMTMDGRLSLIWAFVACCAIVVVWEAWPWVVAHRRDRNRRVALARRYGKNAKFYR